MSFVAQITADISNFDKNIKKATDIADSSTKKMQAQFDRLGDSFVRAGTKASILSAGLVAVGTKAFLMAADIEDAVGATEQIFGNNADSVNAWASKLDTSFGIAKKEALEYSNLMGSMLINIGKLTEQEASKQSAKLIELAGDLTAMYGGSTQDAVRALTGALKGNNTMLDNYGMAVNEALIKQKALELGLMGTSGEMTLQAKQGATLALIWEQTGAAQGQAAREAEGASGAMRALKTEITNLTTELGEVLLPVITPIVTSLKEFVSGIRDLSPEAKKMIVIVAGITAAVGPLLLGLGSLLKMMPLIIAGFTALTGPIGIAVTAIVAGATLIITHWDEIKTASNNVVEYVKDDWERLKESFEVTNSSIAKLMKGDFNGWMDDVKKSFDLTIDYLKNRWEQLKGIFKDDKIGNPDQKLLDAALAANEMTGSMVDNKKAVEETVQPIIDLTEANDDLAKSQERVVESLKAMRMVIPQKEIYSLFNELFTQSGNELILNPVIEPNIDSATLKSKMYESVKGAMGDLSEGIQIITIDLTSMLSSTLTDMFGAVSNAIMNGDSVIDALGVSLLGTLGGIMVELGQMVIVTGTAIEAVKAALTSLGGLGAIAAGVALIAIGSLFSAGARKLGSSMGSGGGYSSAPSMQNSQPTLGNSDYRGAYQDDFRVEFKIGSNELVGVLDTANQRRNRLG
jgi:hypothetical protein